MKKIFVIATIAAATIAMASCNGKEAAENKRKADSIAVVKTSFAEATKLAKQFTDKLNANDTTAMAKISRQIAQKISEQVANGNTGAAKAYKIKLGEVLDKNIDKVLDMKVNGMCVADIITNILFIPTADEGGDGEKDGERHYDNINGYMIPRE